MSATSRKTRAGSATKNPGPGCLVAFFLLFLVVGAGLLYFITLRPALQVYGARHWEKTPCVVESSQVVAHSDSDGSTYSIEVSYNYFFAGRPYFSQRYHFTTGSTGGRKSKDAIVARYPAGTETYCYVNPAAPDEAVIDRGLQPELAFGAVGLLFALVGGGGMYLSTRSTGLRITSADASPKTPIAGGGPRVLKPHATPLAKFVGMVAFSVIWNVFIGVFVYVVFFAEDARHVPWFAKAIISLLALIGVASIFGIFTTFLALFNPRIRLTAQTTTVALGGELPLAWTVTGRVGMLRKLRIVLEGREEADHQRGTSTSTETRVFATLPVFETADREFLSQGSARVALPSHLMHTIEGGRNRVLWRLKVEGEIPRWPDVADEYPIVVLPLPLPK